MKTLNALIILMTSLVSLNSFAAQKIITCTNGEETKVTIVEISQDVYRADVTVQSTGDSYPTFHFKNVKELPQTRRIAAAVYECKDFRLTIYPEVRIHAILDVPSLGLEKELLTNCHN